MIRSSKPVPKKKKRCRICRNPYQPVRALQAACSPKCALDLVELKKQRAKAKEKRAEARLTRQQKEAIKTKPQLTKEAQKWFNAWVRLRDHGKPCPSCGGVPDNAGLITGSRIDAGHYRGTGANPELRFEPLNVHAQCVKCNRYLSGNVTNFRIGLVDRIGQANLEWLEGPHESPHWTHDELREIRELYRSKVKELRKQREAGEAMQMMQETA